MNSDGPTSDPSKLPDAVRRRLQDLTRRSPSSPGSRPLPSPASLPSSPARSNPLSPLAGLARSGGELAAKRATRRPTIDILFMHDATGSILTVIADLHKMVREVTAILQEKFDARFGLLCYRGDCNQPDAVEVVPIGNAEPFLGRFGTVEHRNSSQWESPIDAGLVKAGELEWSSETRVLILLGDARPMACEVHSWQKAAEALRAKSVSSYIVWWKTNGLMRETAADRPWFEQLAGLLGARFFASTDISPSELAGFVVGSVLQASGQLEQPGLDADLSLKLPGFAKMKRLLLSTPTSTRPALGDGSSSSRRRPGPSK